MGGAKKEKKKKDEGFASQVEDMLDAMFTPEGDQGVGVTTVAPQSDTAVPVDIRGAGDDLQSETSVLGELEGTHGTVSGGKNKDTALPDVQQTPPSSTVVSTSNFDRLHVLQAHLEQSSEECAAIISSQLNFSIDIGVVLGSGLTALVDRFGSPVFLPTSHLPGWPKSSLYHEEIELVAGQLSGRGILVIPHRVHCYEGFEPCEVTYVVRVLGKLGARMLITTNASGSLSPKAPIGRMLVINDHIDLLGQSPLQGRTDGFINMTHAYDQDLIHQAHIASNRLNVRMSEGVYVAVPGPEYETPAMATYLRRMGADVVGMSTVPEVIEARYQHMKVLGISAVVNESGAVNEHEDVLEEGSRISGDLDALLATLLQNLRF